MKEVGKKILTLPLRLALIILIIGALFKIMHWPYSSQLMFLGSILIAVLYLIRFFNKKLKLRLDYVKLALVILWVFDYLVTVFHFYNIPYLLEICLTILFIWWFVEEGFFYYKNRKFKKKGIAKIVYFILTLIASSSLLCGFLFKIQHWPYGSELFVLGTLILCAILLLDYFVIKPSTTN